MFPLQALLVSMFVVCHAHNPTLAARHATECSGDNAVLQGKMTSTDVTIDSGTVRGRTANLPSGREYYSFQGIPYAKPPLGDLRFRPPEAVEEWTGVLETVKPGNGCLQESKFKTSSELISEDNGWYTYGDEDCLYLNVYSASLDKKLPVMVWIHGGYFSMGDGSPDTYGPEILLEKDIVLVTINYRLDAFGFLNLDLDECSGNMGLKDQTFALKWVQKNIEKFGGDPNKVVVFGESAGAISTAIHLVSPHNKGLFNKAVIMSGHSTGTSTYTSGTDTAKIYAKLLGNDSEDPKELLDFFKSLPAKDLIGANMKIKTHLNEKVKQFMIPVIEKDYIQNAFITKKPVDYINQGEVIDVPIITGITSNEGIHNLPDLIDDIDFLVDNIASSLTAYDIDANIFETEVKKVYDFSKKINALTELYMDQYFFYPTMEMVQLLHGVIKSPIYLYCHDFTSERDAFRLMSLEAAGLSEDDVEGACHADDYVYFFQSHTNEHVLIDGTGPAKVSNTYTKLLTNFANTGNPNGDNIGINWPQYEKDSNNFLVIKEDLEVNPTLFEERINLWKSMTQN